jgi:hypothetical protein
MTEAADAPKEGIVPVGHSEDLLRKILHYVDLARGTDHETDSGRLIGDVAPADLDYEIRLDLESEFPYILVPRQNRTLELYANESPFPFMVTAAGNIETFVYPRLRTLRIVAKATANVDLFRIELSSREYKYQTRLGVSDVAVTTEVTGIDTIATLGTLTHITDIVSTDGTTRGNSTHAIVTIAAAGVAQDALAANAARKYAFIQNPSTSGGTLWFQWGANAVMTAPSIELLPGQSYESPSHWSEVGRLSVIHPVTGVGIVAKEG